MVRAPERSRTVARGRFPAGPGARSHPESTSMKTLARARAEKGRATGAGKGGGGASAEEGHRRRRHDDAAVSGEGRRRQHEDWGRRSGGGGNEQDRGGLSRGRRRGWII